MWKSSFEGFSECDFYGPRSQSIFSKCLSFPYYDSWILILMSFIYVAWVLTFIRIRTSPGKGNNVSHIILLKSAIFTRHFRSCHCTSYNCFGSWWPQGEDWMPYCGTHVPSMTWPWSSPWSVCLPLLAWHINLQQSQTALWHFTHICTIAGPCLRTGCSASLWIQATRDGVQLTLERHGFEWRGWGSVGWEVGGCGGRPFAVQTRVVQASTV